MNEVHPISLSDGTLVECRINRSPRARRLRLTLKQDRTLFLTLPGHTGTAEVRDFIRKSIPWLEKTLRKVSSAVPKTSAALYPSKFHFKLTSERFPIRYEWHNVCWVGAKENGNHILVSGEVLRPELVQEALRLYLIRKAENLFGPMLRKISEKCGIPFGNLTIRYQKGRWGSCSPGKDISLNAQMLFLPPEAVEYIMIHELCHVRELNHSPRFWKLVAAWCPDCLKIRRNIRSESPPYLPLSPKR